MSMQPAPPLLLACQEAELLAKQIEAEIAGAVDGERKLDQSWARVGALLSRFESTKGYKVLGFESFPKYLNSLREKYGRSNGQLWAYKEVAHHLSPSISEGDLDKMGVSKAFEIARAMKIAEKPPTPELIAAALDPATTVKEVRALAHRIYDLPANEEPKGTWLDLGGFYASADERKLLMETYELGARLLELSPNVPEWLKRKEVHIAMAREFHGTHMAEVYGPVQELEREDSSSAHADVD